MVKVVSLFLGILFSLSQVSCRQEPALQKKETPSLKQTSWKPAQIELPDQVKAYLDRDFPGWSLNENYSSFDSIANQIYDSNYPFNPNLLQGDFDGNERLDFAMSINYNGLSKQQDIFVAFFDNGEGFDEHIIDSAEASSQRYLWLEKKGNVVHDFDTEKDIVLARDAISVKEWKQGTITYFYVEGKFEAIITGD